MVNRDINALLEEYYNTPGALLLDVREADEYAEGHIPGAKNVRLQALRDVSEELDPDTPLYVYCQSGGRSFKAATVLRVWVSPTSPIWAASTATPENGKSKQ